MPLGLEHCRLCCNIASSQSTWRIFFRRLVALRNQTDFDLHIYTFYEPVCDSMSVSYVDVYYSTCLMQIEYWGSW
jgi:hypothetical protein